MTAEFKADGEGIEDVEVHVWRIASTLPKSPSILAALRDVLRADGSNGSGEGLGERLGGESAV